MSKSRQRTKERRVLKKKARTKAIRKERNIRKNNFSKNDAYYNPMDEFDFDKGVDTGKLLKAISETITVVGPVHAAIEISETLIKEGTIEPFSEEEYKVIDKFDEAVVKFSEDVRAVNEFVEMEKETEQYIEILFNLSTTVEEMTDNLLPQLMEDDKPLGRNKALLDDYVAEHKAEGEGYLDFAFRVHNNRIIRIFDKYKTIIPTEADPEFKELVDNLTEDIAEGEFEEVYEVEPTVVKDAEDAGPLNS